MFFHLGNHVENTLCNFWVKKCGIPIEYTTYFSHCGKCIKFVSNCAEYFMYSSWFNNRMRLHLVNPILALVNAAISLPFSPLALMESAVPLCQPQLHPSSEMSHFQPLSAACFRPPSMHLRSGVSCICHSVCQQLQYDYTGVVPPLLIRTSARAYSTLLCQFAVPPHWVCACCPLAQCALPC